MGGNSGPYGIMTGQAFFRSRWTISRGQKIADSIVRTRYARVASCSLGARKLCCCCWATAAKAPRVQCAHELLVGQLHSDAAHAAECTATEGRRVGATEKAEAAASAAARASTRSTVAALLPLDPSEHVHLTLTRCAACTQHSRARQQQQREFVKTSERVFCRYTVPSGESVTVAAAAAEEAVAAARARQMLIARRRDVAPPDFLLSAALRDALHILPRDKPEIQQLHRAPAPAPHIELHKRQRLQHRKHHPYGDRRRGGSTATHHRERNGKLCVSRRQVRQLRKVVLLIRDPRGVLQSRKHREWCPNEPDCFDPTTLCSDMVSDYNAAVRFLKLYPDTFSVIRYEDLSLDPFAHTDKLFKFFGLHYHENVQHFLETHTKTDIGGLSSTFRNSKTAPFHWRTELDFDEVDEIQQECDQAMKLWGYAFARNATHQKTFDPVTSCKLLDNNRV
ncbi:unnamed protein product [Trichogramma brassicae]|uniref:Sulfotransferase domain-containing protein n=1 Tax=Trichogramma brassicae TaxID=86971 RepID=A0A6H5HYL5_9HYME|nr:unnamed protein product [Trichogramma brassicae]